MYGEHFYNNVTKIEPTVADIEMLKRCNWTYYDGIFDKAAGNYVIRGILRSADFDKNFVIKEFNRLIENKNINKKLDLKKLKEWKEQIEGDMPYEMLAD